MVTPRNFGCFTVSTSASSSLTFSLVFASLGEVVNRVAVVFSGASCILQSLAHSETTIVTRSARFSHSSTLFPSTEVAKSSANWKVCTPSPCSFLGKSSTYMINRSGAMTLPCGTPAFKVRYLPSAPFILTRALRSSGKA